MTQLPSVPSIIISSRAFTPESVDPVDALAAVGAGVREAFVDVGLAVLTREAWDALAGVSEDDQGVLEGVDESGFIKDIRFVCVSVL